MVASPETLAHYQAIINRGYLKQGYQVLLRF